jgi:hypothetical protein
VYRSLRRGGRPGSTSFIVAPPAARMVGAVEAEAAGCTVALGCHGEIDADGLGVAALVVVAAPPFGADLQPTICSDIVMSAIVWDKRSR